MKHHLTILLLLITVATGFAQKPELQLSGKHLGRIENTEDPRDKLRKFHKFYSKDSSRYAKQVEKYWQQKSDSLLKASQQEEYARQLEQFPLDSGAVGEMIAEKGNVPDSTDLAGKLPVTGRFGAVKDSIQNVDSAAVKEKVTALAKNEIPDSSRIAGAAWEKSGLSGYKDDISRLRTDSLQGMPGQYAQKGAGMVESKFTDRDEVDVFKDQKEELEAMKNGPANYKAQVEQYQDTDKLKEEAQQKAREEMIANIVNHQEELGAVQKKISAMQRKYASVLNSNDLSTAVKRTSLKGKPFRERLFIGGNFNVNNLDPVSIDASPQVGYKFNRKFIAGVGGSYRYTFGKDSISSIPAIPEDSYGYRAFSSYDIFSNFFIYGEYERMAKEIKQAGADETSTQWVEGLMLGAGREFSVHPKLNMTIMVLYNFLYDPQNAIYPKPWTVKLGFHLSELGLLKK